MIRLDADGLCEEALRRRPNTSFRDVRFLEGLRVLSEAIRDGVPLHQPGKRLLQAELLRVLDQRLAAEQAGVFDINGPPPWSRLAVVSGLPRTASTFFHQTVAEAPDVVAPTLSQLLYPMSVDERTGDVPSSILERVRLELALARRLSPSLHHTHPMSPRSPEECIHALQLTLASEKFSFMLPVPSYDEWLHAQDPLPRYRQLRQIYTHLFAHRADRYTLVVLKAPTHAFWASALETELSPHTIVIMRRPVAEVEPSFTRLLLALRRVFCDTEPLYQRTAEDAKRWVRLWEQRLDGVSGAVYVDRHTASLWTSAALRTVILDRAPLPAP